TSYPNRTSVVLRGKYLLDNVLAAPPPGPPADVPGLDEEGVGTKESLRAQMEAHRTNPTCASCHVRMDPLGFGLENYDATGKWRTMDGSFAVDASGELPNGRRFDGPAELKALLAENLHDFAGGLAEKLMTYALGRGPESAYDRKVLRDIVQASAASDYRLRAMITEVALSVPFRERSGPAAAPEERAATNEGGKRRFASAAGRAQRRSNGRPRTKGGSACSSQRKRYRAGPCCAGSASVSACPCSTRWCLRSRSHARPSRPCASPGSISLTASTCGT